MQYNYICYTTSKSGWYQLQANKVAKRLSNTKGRSRVTIDVVYQAAPKKIALIKDNDGDVRPSWDWFGLNFERDGYDGVFWHFTPFYKRKWGISKRINGSKNSRNKEYPEFWLCCGKEGVDGYQDLTNFERLLYHELAHFDEDLDDKNGNLLPQNSVHIWDYDLKQIHNYHLLVSYEGYNMKKKVRDLLDNVIDYVKNVLAALSARNKQ